jgi:hypothetical protein
MASPRKYRNRKNAATAMIIGTPRSDRAGSDERRRGATVRRR